MGDLRDTPAIVSGGARGIGRAVVERLVEEGCRVLFTYNDSATQATALEQELRVRGGEVSCMQAKVQDLASCQAAVRRTVELYGGVGVVVNNAGKVIDGPFLTMKETSWREVIEVELFGTINLSHAALPELMRHPGGASIVNLGSITGDTGNPGQINHAASKAGVVGFTKALGQELGPFGVRVNCVSPGPIDTGVLDHVPARRKEKWQARIPLRRFGQASEVADVVAFLAGGRSSYITGQVIGVTGGLASAF